MTRILFIRFSSLGDITQALAAALALKNEFPRCEIHWVVRSDFETYLKEFPFIDRVWSLNRDKGFSELFSLGLQLHAQKYDLVYDAHSNVRSHVLCSILRILNPLQKIVRRPKERFKRFLLFRFRINRFPDPFRGATSFVTPLEKFLERKLSVPKPQMKSSDAVPAILLAPSAAWEMKRWPVPYWRKLIELMKDEKFVLLGGNQDTFLTEIQNKAPDRVTNLGGQWDWLQTLKAIQNARLVISGDTGVLHMADLLAVPTIAIIGPTAFGYPFRETSKVLETKMYCKPCSKDGRGKCVNRIYKKCLFDVSPEKVSWQAEELLGHSK